MIKSKCAICGGSLITEKESHEFGNETETLVRCVCNKCNFKTSWRDDEVQAILRWNDNMEKMRNGEYQDVVKSFRRRLNNESKRTSN